MEPTPVSNLSAPGALVLYRGDVARLPRFWTSCALGPAPERRSPDLVETYERVEAILDGLKPDVTTALSETPVDPDTRTPR
jgi:hypothetical protein